PYAARFSPDGSLIAVGYYHDTANVSVLSARDLSLLFTPDIGGVTTGNLSSVAWSADGRFLFAGGRYWKQFDSYTMTPIRRWSESGRGSFSDTAAANDAIFDLAPLPDGRIAFGTNDPAVGLLDLAGKRTLFVPPSIADYRDSQEKFLISGDGVTVRFGYEHGGKSPAAFDLGARNLNSVNPTLSGGKLSTPDTTSLPISGWKNTTAPKLNNVPLKIEPYETSRSLAIAPGGSSFILGTEWYLRRFDRQGKQIWAVPAPGAVWAVNAVNISGNGSVVIAAYDDGTIRWHWMVGGKELVAFFPHPDKKRWVLWTPEGYFDASPGGGELIGYHINQGKEKEARFVPISYLYDVFYRPDIVQAKFKDEDISSLITLTAVEALQTPPPEVKFTSIPKESPGSKAKVCYQIKSTGGGIGEVRLFQNGKLIKSDGFYREVAKKESTEKIQLASLNSRAIYNDQRGLVVNEKQTATFVIAKPKGELVHECVEIETIAGENEISLAAFNAPNTVQGFMDTATFNSTRKPDEPHLYILSVGIDTYRDSSINLKYAAKDAKDFIAILPEKARSIYKSENIHLITLADQQAGKQNIMKNIDELSAQVKHGDGFIFFNASHGVLLQNQYYIVTADFNGDLNNTNTLISSNEIVEMSKRIKSLSQLFIFDTCHAGGVDNIISGLYDARMVNL
ncbi:MAG: caspase family protein, partial [Deltaproteobacteria bacterium]